MASSSAEASNQDLDAIDEELSEIEHQIEALLCRQSSLRKLRERLHRDAPTVIPARPITHRSRPSPTWEAQLDSLLKNTFQLSSWRTNQREVINATLHGRDVLCLMPAGGGKSLCYQLPALIAASTTPGAVTVVISPLLALIQDQVHHLEVLGIPAAALSSLSSTLETKGVLQSLDSAQTSPTLVYCTPERIVSSKRFLSKLEKLYKSNRLARIAVDESHCASQWGNDFRPDYRKLCILRQQFPNTPIIALTATATAPVRTHIMDILQMNDAEVFKSSIDRPNLYYEVRQKTLSGSDLADDVAKWIKTNFPPPPTTTTNSTKDEIPLHSHPVLCTA